MSRGAALSCGRPGVISGTCRRRTRAVAIPSWIVLARFAALGLVLTATSLAASTPARAQSPAPPAAPPAAADGVLVHIATPAEVDLEVQRGRDWVPICTSPCDRLVRPGESYRVSSDHVPTSNVFAIAPAPRVTLHVDPSTKQSRIGGVILIVLGGVGLVPAGVVTVGVATFFLGAVILVCPIAAGSNSSYGNCVAGAPGLVTPLYGSPYVSIPGLVGAVLAAAGATSSRRIPDPLLAWHGFGRATTELADQAAAQGGTQ